MRRAWMAPTGSSGCVDCGSTGSRIGPGTGSGSGAGSGQGGSGSGRGSGAGSTASGSSSAGSSSNGAQRGSSSSARGRRRGAREHRRLHRRVRSSQRRRRAAGRRRRRRRLVDGRRLVGSRRLVGAAGVARGAGGSSPSVALGRLLGERAPFALRATALALQRARPRDRRRCARDGRRRVRRGASAGHLPRVADEPVLEQHRGRARVLARAGRAGSGSRAAMAVVKRSS